MAKTVTLEELRNHKTKDSLYVLLHDKGVYLLFPHKHPITFFEFV